MEILVNTSHRGTSLVIKKVGNRYEVEITKGETTHFMYELESFNEAIAAIANEYMDTLENVRISSIAINAAKEFLNHTSYF